MRRASLAVESRCLTLYEQVHIFKSKEKSKIHLAFITVLKAILAEDCLLIIVSDAGFRVPWFKLVSSFGWHWIGRVRNRTFIQSAEEQDWSPCKAFYHKASAIPKALDQAKMARNNPIDCQLVVYKGKSKGRIDKNRSG